MVNNPTLITKTTYVQFCKCPSLYYYNNKHPEENTPTEYENLLIYQGNEVGKLARSYFPNTLLITGNNEKEKYENTIKAIADGKENIAEASFICDDLFCSVDLLHKVDDGYEIYEVKSTTHIENHHVDDVSFQTYVLRKLGYNIKASYVLYVNNQYIFKDFLEVNKYFNNGIINIKDNIESNINLIRAIKSKPITECNKHCRKCNYFKRCFNEIPSNNIFELADYKYAPDKYNEGIITFKDILNSNMNINHKQLQQIEHTLNDLPRYVDVLRLKDFLDDLIFPLYHLDFETTEDVIPFINNTHPRQKRIVQYSLHIQEALDSELIHKEYLQTSNYDNLKEVAESLINDLKDKGSIIVYHSSFEGKMIKELAKILPEYSDKLLALVDRIIDLETPFKNRYVYDKKLKGKSTIKKVLPTFCEEFETAYTKLPLVHNGTDAMTYFSKMMEAPETEKEDIKHALLKYCELDTLAMVEILKELFEMLKVYS